VVAVLSFVRQTDKRGIPRVVALNPFETQSRRFLKKMRSLSFDYFLKYLSALIKLNFRLQFPFVKFRGDNYLSRVSSRDAFVENSNRSARDRMQIVNYPFSIFTGAIPLTLELDPASYFKPFTDLHIYICRLFSNSEREGK